MTCKPTESLRLWYTHPAPQWDHALPIGNGRLGAVIFGRTAAERIQLNEESLWAGGPRDMLNPRALESLGEVRRLLFAGHPQEAYTLAEETLLGIPGRIQPYQTLGDLSLTFAGHEDVEAYHLELDLEEAVVRVSYRVDGATFTREAFASYPDQVVIVRLSTDRPGQIDCDATLSREEAAGVRLLAADCPRLLFSGQLDEGEGVRFVAEVRALSEGGRCEGTGDVLQIRAADAVTLFLTAATDYRGGDPEVICTQLLDAAQQRDYATLRARHVADYRALFERVQLDLGGEPVEAPTDERLTALRQGTRKCDPDLVRTYFQFGRYLLISSSRPAHSALPALNDRPPSLPANLQGVWNDSLTPAWNSDFHTNINLQMNYWPAEVANLSECHLPLFDLLETLVAPGQATAQKMYGVARGFVLHHITDAWGFTVPADGPWGIWPLGGAWTALHAWEHYAFTRDLGFLRERGYPLLREAAHFFLDYLVEDQAGQLVSGPSSSPENRYRMADGTEGYMCMGPTMDNQVIRELFTVTLSAAALLDVDADLRIELAEARDRLPPTRIGKHGQVMEWREDYEEVEPGHRHVSHLFGLYPGTQISPAETPALAEAARVTLERRLAHGGGHTGWSRAWIVNFWARLKEGAQAHRHLLALLRERTLPNLWDTHPPFQIDGNLGATAGIAEMLLQSHTSSLVLLPALPEAWAQGCFRGLRARGDLTVDLVWRAGQCEEARIQAGPHAAGRVSLRCARGTPVAEVTCDGVSVPFDVTAAGVHWSLQPRSLQPRSLQPRSLQPYASYVISFTTVGA